MVYILPLEFSAKKTFSLNTCNWIWRLNYKPHSRVYNVRIYLFFMSSFSYTNMHVVCFVKNLHDAYFICRIKCCLQNNTNVTVIWQSNIATIYTGTVTVNINVSHNCMTESFFWRERLFKLSTYNNKYSNIAMICQF